jgi:hypothetical protein
MEWASLKAKKGDRILPKWEGLLEKADNINIVVGKHTRMTSLPSGGILVSGVPPIRILRHPWRVGGMNDESGVQVRSGMVAGVLPWVTEEFRLGDVDENGETVRVTLKPKKEGVSYLAVGINVGNSSSANAEIDANGTDTWEQIRLAEITELPRGFGTGGVAEDDDGWAWYPLVRFTWDDNRISKQFQIVMHNLGHIVVRGSNNDTRHYFPPL